MSSERINLSLESENAANEAELSRFYDEYAVEESDDFRTFEKSLIPDYLGERFKQPEMSNAEIAALGASAVERRVKLPNLPADFFYNQNISRIKKSDIYRTKPDQFDLHRYRNSFETKQDLILSVATIFANYSSEGSGLGYLTQFPDEKLESEGRSKNYGPARDYVISFLAEVKSRLPERYYKNAKGENLPIERIIRDALSAEGVNWFGPGYEVKERALKSGRERFEDKFGQRFATRQVFKEGTKPRSENMGKVRREYLSDLSEIVKSELKQYKSQSK